MASFIHTRHSSGTVVIMGETLTVGLTNDQRDLLLRGLRFVRSAVLLEMEEPTPEYVAGRTSQLNEIESLVEQLNGPQPAGAAARR
jgi:hypothetical protein